VLLAPLPDTHTAIDLRDTLTRLIARLPAELMRSLAWDQGNQMAQNAQFVVESGLHVYYCDPPSPWQRGSNENSAPLMEPMLVFGAGSG
jgi:IS30 family transposase